MRRREFGFQAREFFFEIAYCVEHLRDLLPYFVRAGFQCRCRRGERVFLLLHPRQRAFGSDRFDTPHTRSDAGFAHHFEKADVAGARHMRAAAQFARGTDIEHTHFVAVFLAE